jgi:hypothetical protein
VTLEPTRNPNDPQNWALACTVCGEEFAKDVEMGMVRAHFDLIHEMPNEGMTLNLLWKGVGPAPMSAGNR